MAFLRLVLLVSALLVISWAACPNNCSGHGTCNTSTSVCQCSQTWTGSDCSIQNTTLTTGVKVSGQTVATRSWHYFNIAVGGGTHTVTFYVNETSSGDADLYIRKDALPTRSEYFKRNITVGAKTFLSTGDDYGAGRWYLGVYGFIAVSFDVQAVISSACPNDCSGHGQCVSSQCVCAAGWSGLDCSQQIQTLQPNTYVESSVGDRQWKYFSIDTNEDLMLWIVNQTSVGDADLYIKYNELPTLTSYDYRETTIQPNYDILITNPLAGKWYAGVYGFRGCNFKIKVLTEEQCPNDCSGASHGTCNGFSCSCTASFSGSYCETMVPALSLQQTVSGYVQESAWNYYHINTFSTSDLVVSVTEGQPNGDCDVYVQLGKNPTRFDFMYREIGLKDTFNITIEDPSQGAWYIGVYGFTNCGYSLTTTETVACPNNCNGRGQCSFGVCNCDAGWGGEDCSVSVNTLVSGVGVSNTIGNNNWQIYSIKLNSASRFMRVDLKETATSGYVWLYANALTAPTLRDYDYSATNTNSAKGININSFGDNVTYYIGVYGDPFSPTDRTTDYQLVAWYPPF